MEKEIEARLGAIEAVLGRLALTLQTPMRRDLHEAVEALGPEVAAQAQRWLPKKPKPDWE